MQKSLQIVFRDIEPSEALDKAIRDRAAKLERFVDHITACRVVVEIPHCAAHAGKKPLAVAVEVEVPNRPMIIAKFEEDRHDMKGSQTVVINRAFDAVQRQLEEIADIRKGRVKMHEAGHESGVVTELFPAQHYGFVEVKGASDLYFTRNCVAGDAFDEIDIGTLVQVTRASSEGPMGPQASSVRLLEKLKSQA